MSHVLRLMYPVGPDREPDETDIVTLKQSLERIGQYAAPNWQKAADYDAGLFKAVEDFQRSKGLKIDGVVKPRGPTAEAIAAELGPASPLVMEKDPRPVPGIRDPYRFPLDIDANARASNQRTVKALRHAGKYGLLPGLAATAWQKGDSGKAQVVDLFHQVGADDARGGTGHARNLADRFLPMIPRDDRGLFRGLLGRRGDADQRIAAGRPIEPLATPSNAQLAQNTVGKSFQEKARELRSQIDPTKPGWQEKYLDFVENHYRSLVAEGKRHGLKLAPEFLEHYLDRSGKPRFMTRTQVRALKPVANTEERNQRVLVESFYSRRKPNGAKHKNWQLLVNLQDGKSISLGRTTIKNDFKMPELIATGEFDTALGAGRSNIRSIGNFDAHRVGNIIHIHGNVSHVWKDRYDFHKFQPGADGALALRDGGRAKEFDFGAEWKQSVAGTLQIFPDGRLGNPRFQWSDLP